MNDLDQLRSTLDQHAADLVDHDVHARVGAVHHRVRVVRRRRRAALGGAAALSLAVVAGVALLPGGHDRPDPGAPTLAGLDVPTRLESLGYAYDYVSGVEGDGTAEIALTASDAPRLVSWGTAGADDRVTVRDTSRGDATYTGPDFGDFVWVSPGVAGTVAVSGTGPVALAVYDLADLAPAGVSGAGTTFRETVAGKSLLGAVIGEPGQAEVVVPATATGDAVSYRAFCVGAPEGAVLQIELADGGLSVGGCDETVPFDAGSGSSASLPTTPGEDATARVWVSDGEDGPMVESDDLRVGVGLYDASSDTERVAGSSVPDLVEHQGHVYRLDRLVTTSPGDRALDWGGSIAESRPVLVTGYSSVGEATVELSSTGDAQTTRSEGVGVSNAPIGLISGDESATARIIGAVPPDARLALAIYVRAD